MVKNLSLFLVTFLLVGFIVTSCGEKKSNEVSLTDDSLKNNDVSTIIEVAELNEVLGNKDVLSTIEASSDEVIIGNQVWMNKNLDLDKFRNGDPIPQTQTASDWIKAGKNGQPAWCYYDRDPSNYEKLSDIPSNVEKYGKLYNWFAVNDPRGLAPFGWHVPSDQEWKTLQNYLGGEYVETTRKMQSTSAWPKEDNATNSSGFSALPSGSRRIDGTFVVPKSSSWWSSSELPRSRDFAIEYSLCSRCPFFSSANPLTSGFSVRLIKD
jgi:uncharacterized protein (TIGR02145 family)